MLEKMTSHVHASTLGSEDFTTLTRFSSKRTLGSHVGLENGAARSCRHEVAWHSAIMELWHSVRVVHDLQSMALWYQEDLRAFMHHMP